MARCALDHEIAVHRPRQIATDGETEARSLVRRGEFPLELDEGLEDRAQLLRRDADTAVGDSDANGRRVAATGDLDRAAGSRELDRVREEVEQDLTDLLLIGE